jgi:chemotaxis protein methyltransferase CheR
VFKYTGLDLSKYNESFLDRAIQNKMEAKNLASIEEYQIYLDNHPEEGLILEEDLQITYSEFFRNSLSFAVLEHLVFPFLLKKTNKKQSKEIRIWSAACASGQECYSVAILLEELQQKYQEKVDYRIFATDQNEQQLIHAKAGIFSAEAIQSLSLHRIQQWFICQGDTYTVVPKVKENIDFSLFDLLGKKLICPSASIFGDFDLIICANLLFYYKPEYQMRMIDKVSKCLAVGGYIMTGETEREILLKQGFREVSPQSAVFHGKVTE